MVPTGRTSSEEVRSLMRRPVQECHEILRWPGGGEGSPNRVRMPLKDSGPPDVYQWLIVLVLHDRRHLAQMTANEAPWKPECGLD